MGFAIPTVCTIRICNPKYKNVHYSWICCWIINPKNTRTGIANPSDKPELFTIKEHIRKDGVIIPIFQTKSGFYYDELLTVKRYAKKDEGIFEVAI